MSAFLPVTRLELYLQLTQWLVMHLILQSGHFQPCCLYATPQLQEELYSKSTKTLQNQKCCIIHVVTLEYDRVISQTGKINNIACCSLLRSGLFCAVLTIGW